MGALLNGIRNAISGLDDRPSANLTRLGGLPLINLTNGAKVNATGVLDAYYSNAFRACLLAKARPLSTLPVDVYVRDNGVRREATSHVAKRLSGLLRHRWNPFLTGSEGIRWLVMTKDTLGNAFARVEYSGGLPVAIYPLSHAPDVRRTDNGSAVFVYDGDSFTKPGTYLSYEIIWVKSPLIDADGLYGVSLAEVAARELGLSIDLEDFYIRLMRNGNHFPGYLETDKELRPQDITKLKEQFEDGAGIIAAGKVRIFDNGLSYKQSDLTMADMSLVDQERWVLQQTCRTLSVPPQEVFELSNATYSNIEQGARNFANKTLVTEAVTIEQAFNDVLWEANHRDEYVRFNMDGLLRGDYESRMNGYRTAIYSGIYSPNDVRAKEEEAPYEGGQYFLVSSAYSQVDPETGEVVREARTASEPGGSGEGVQQTDGNPNGRPPDGESRDALSAVHADMERRIAERFRERGDSQPARDFAAKVLAPYADACAIARIPYDMTEDIERMAADA